MAGPAITHATARAGRPVSVTIANPAITTASARSGTPSSTVATGPALAHSTTFAGHGTSTPGLRAGTGFGAGSFGDSPFGEGTAGSAGVATATSSTFAGHPVSIARYRTAASMGFALRGQPLDVTALLDVATHAADRSPIFGLRADWAGNNSYAHPLADLTPVVEQFTLTRSISGELPEDIGIIEGSASATFTATLGGTWQPTYDGPIDTDPVKAFAPYRPDADLAGTPVIGRQLSLTTGMLTEAGPVPQQRFTGTLTGFSPSAAARQTTVEALDYVTSKLRVSIVQPAYGAERRYRQIYGARYPWSYNSQWFIDRALRAGGFYASPPPPVALDDSSLLLSTTMHGSPAPENPNAYALPPEFALPTAPVGTPSLWEVGDHPFGMLAPDAGVGVQRFDWQIPRFVPFTSGSGIAVRALMVNPGAGVALTAPVLQLTGFRSGFYDPVQNGPTIGLGWSAGDLQVTIRTDAGATSTITFDTPTPATATWQFVAAHVAFTATGATVTWYVDGEDGQGTMTFTPNPTTNWAPTLHATAILETPAMSVSNVAWWTTPTVPAEWIGSSWVPTASIDVGANTVYGWPDIGPVEAFAFIKEVASAEFGQFGSTEDKLPYFRSRVASHPPARRESVTADYALVDLVTKVDEATVRNHIDVVASPTVVADWDVILEAKGIDDFTVAANTTGIWTIPRPDHLVQTWGFTSGYAQALRVETFNDWQLWSTYWQRAKLIYQARRADSTTTEVTTGLAFYVDFIDLNYLQLAIVNSNAFPVQFATAGGQILLGSDPDHPQLTEFDQPSLVLYGMVANQDPSATGWVRVPGSIAIYGNRSWDLGGNNVWRQDVPAALTQAAALLEWTASPKPVLSEVEVPHDPRRKLYDQVTVVDPEGLGSVTGTLAGITTTFSDGEGARDQLLVRPNDPPPGW